MIDKLANRLIEILAVAYSFSDEGSRSTICDFYHYEIADFVVNYCQDRGLIVYWLLFEHRAVRLSPPLTLTDEEIKEGCDIILEALNQFN